MDPREHPEEMDELVRTYGKNGWFRGDVRKKRMLWRGCMEKTDGSAGIYVKNGWVGGDVWKERGRDRIGFLASRKGNPVK